MYPACVVGIKAGGSELIGLVCCGCSTGFDDVAPPELSSADQRLLPDAHGHSAGSHNAPRMPGKRDLPGLWSQLPDGMCHAGKTLPD